MKKAHLDYLKRAVNIAINLKGIADVTAQIAQLRSFCPPIYGVIRDVAGDRRFYGVTENTPFWHRYTLASVYDFVESISRTEWSNSQQLTERIEDFLNEWFVKHALPMNRSEEAEIELDLQAKGWSKPESTSTDNSHHLWDSGADFYRGRISDCTNDPHQAYTDCNWPCEISIFATDSNKEAALGQTSEGIGNAPGMAGEHHRAEAVFMNRIDPTLRKLAMMIGRSDDTASSEVHGRFQHARRSDISGVTVGDNLNSLLPVELALLGDQTTEDIFYRKYSQKRLQVFSSSSFSTEQISKKKGAIFMCVDTSGSMSGDPEMMAKKLALAIAIIAQRECRPVCILNYSDDLSFFVLRNFTRQRREFLKFLGHSYGGGNNENLLFSFLFKQLPKLPRYSKFSRHFRNADLLVVSDFIWSALNEDVLKLINDAQFKGMKVYTLTVGEFSELYDEKDVYDFFPGGPDFLQMSDYQFQFTGSKVIEINKSKTDKSNGTKNETSGRDSLHARKLRTRNDN